MTISQTGKSGFTLTELLVVTTIILVIAASALTIIPGLRKKTEKTATKALMDRLELALDQYYDDHRSYPAGDITDVKTALHPPDSVAKRYIEFDAHSIMADDNGDENIVDAWGNPLVYTTPGSQNPGSFDLYSTGSNGVSSSSGDDADDINNWSR